MGNNWVDYDIMLEGRVSSIPRFENGIFEIPVKVSEVRIPDDYKSDTYSKDSLREKLKEIKTLYHGSYLAIFPGNRIRAYWNVGEIIGKETKPQAIVILNEYGNPIQFIGPEKK